jgi:glucokinase
LASPHVPAGQADTRRFPDHCATLLGLVEGDVNRLTTRLIAQAAVQGDRLSRELLKDATDTLGWALAQTIALVNPARIVVGGGVSLLGQELFFEPVRQACRAAVFTPFADIAEIVPAALGEEVVVHGAVALARAAFHHDPELKAFAP